MKREGLWEKLRLLNPKNLQREVHVYGYRFSWKTHITAVIAALVVIGGIGMLFQLKPLFFAGVLLAVFLVFPVLVLDMYKKMYEQKRFGDACAYMEQLLYAFQKTGKIVSALKEVRGIFEEGQIRLCVGKRSHIWSTDIRSESRAFCVRDYRKSNGIMPAISWRRYTNFC